MASSSVSQEDHEGASSSNQHDFAMASRRAKVRSARANRANTFPVRGEDFDADGGETNIPKYEQTSVVLVEQNDASPKPLCRGINKDKRSIARGAHAGKNNKGVRDRRKLREKRRSTGVMHLPSTESTGGSTGEDENNENSVPPIIPKATCITEPEEKVVVVSTKPACSGGGGKRRSAESEADLDADDEANNSGDVRVNRDRDDHGIVSHLKADNERLAGLLQSKEKRIATLEIQVSQLTRQLSEIREENAKLLRTLNPKP